MFRSTAQNRLRLMVVGEGGVGKSGINRSYESSKLLEIRTIYFFS